MRSQHSQDIGKLVLRLMVGILLLFHAYGVLIGDPGIPNAVAAWKLPRFFAHIALLLEAGGALLIILGLFTEAGAIAIITFMLAGLIMYHVSAVENLRGSGNHLFMLGNNPAGTHHDKYLLEAQAFYLFGAIAVLFLGSGRYALRQSRK
jgi:putative oxidoreductase